VRNLRLTTLADLCRISEPELRQVKNVGEKSVDEIKHALRAYGLSLRDPAKARPSRKSSFNKVPSCPSPSQLNRSPV
jgi:DNA-directed RNA polymerase alpha subunit